MTHNEEYNRTTGKAHHKQAKQEEPEPNNTALYIFMALGAIVFFRLMAYILVKL